MVRLGPLASQGELQKHNADYHKANGMIDKRTAAYFIDKTIVFDAAKNFVGCRNNAFPLPVTNEKTCAELNHILATHTAR